MLTPQEQNDISSLLHREVIPAIGCTEPVAVALCVAKAASLLSRKAEKIEVSLSPNIYKNAMGVGIPNTGMTGLPIAIALGATIGRAELGLQVLRDTTPEAVNEAKRYIDDGLISTAIEQNDKRMLYIKATLYAGNDCAVAVIADSHTRFESVSLNGKEVSFSTDTIQLSSDVADSDDLELSLAKVYEYATTISIDEVEWLWESAEMNVAAAEVSFRGDYGHGLGKMLHDSHGEIFGDTLFAKILAYTSGACDARMSGAMVPVMSNSGSGNQGISATVPVVIFGRAHNVSHEKMLRALVLSHLTVIYIKRSLGRLSALCGCVVAATGSSCGITYLMGGDYDCVASAVKNMVANLTGMICDGAKPGCALKVTSGVATCVLSAVLAINGRHPSSLEGIVDDDVDCSIHNLTNIGCNGMRETDRLILNIMTHKSK